MAYIMDVTDEGRDEQKDPLCPRLFSSKQAAVSSSSYPTRLYILGYLELILVELLIQVSTVSAVIERQRGFYF